MVTFKYNYCGVFECDVVSLSNRKRGVEVLYKMKEKYNEEEKYSIVGIG